MYLEIAAVPSGSIDGHHDLEKLAAPKARQLHDALDRRLALGQPLVDRFVDSSSVYLLSVAENHARTVSDGKPTAEISEVAYRSVQFGMLMACMLLRRRRVPAIAERGVSPYEYDEYAEVRGIVSQDYFQTRPTLETLMTHAQAWLSPNVLHAQFAEQTSGYTLASVDQALYDSYIDRRAQQEMADLDAWDGTFPSR